MIPIISTVVLSALTGAVVYFKTTTKMNKKFKETLKLEKKSLNAELLADMEQERLNILGQFSPFLNDISSFTYDNGKLEFVDNENNVITESTNRITKNATNVKSVDGEVYYEKSVFTVSHDNPATKSRNILVSKDLKNGTELNRDEAKPIIENKIEGLDLIEPVVDFTESSNGTVRVYTSVEEWNNEETSQWHFVHSFIEKKSERNYSLFSKDDLDTVFSGRNNPLEYIKVKKDSFKKCCIYLKIKEDIASELKGFSFKNKKGETSWSLMDSSDIVRIGDDHYIKIYGETNDSEEHLTVNLNYGLITSKKHFIKDQPKIGVFLTEDKTLRLLIK